MLSQVAADFGVSESCLAKWLRVVDVRDGAERAHHEVRGVRSRIVLAVVLGGWCMSCSRVDSSSCLYDPKASVVILTVTEALVQARGEHITAEVAGAGHEARFTVTPPTA